jgi:hypothetical protein
MHKKIEKKKIEKGAGHNRIHTTHPPSVTQGCVSHDGDAYQRRNTSLGSDMKGYTNTEV